MAEDYFKVPMRDYKGGLISEPGIYNGIEMERYHGYLTQIPSISSSGLRTIWDHSPAKYFLTSYLNKNKKPEVHKPHFTLGGAAHHLMLQGKAGFEKEFAVMPEEIANLKGTGSRTEQKAWKDAQGGKKILKQDDVEAIAGMAESLGKEPLVRNGILDGLTERTIIGIDPETGLMQKARPDTIPNHSGDYADLKTTTSVVMNDVAKSIGEFGYQQQAALVGELSERVLGLPMSSFTLVWVEKTPPYSVAVTTLTPEDLHRGRLQNRAAMDAFARCVETGNWTGPSGEQTDAVYCSMAQWKANQIDNKLKALGLIIDEKR